MQPLTSAKPRPPAKRAPSSRRVPTAAATASPSPLARSTNTAPPLVPNSPGEGASSMGKTLDLPDTPPASVDWPSTGTSERAQLEREEDEHAEGGSHGAGAAGGTPGAMRDSEAAAVPFPTGQGGDEDEHSSRRKAPHFEEEEGEGGDVSFVSGGSPSSARDGGGYEEGEAEFDRPLLDASMLRECSREQLEELLQHAGRLFKMKEDELHSFKEESADILNKYEQLRKRHDSLLTRSTSSGSVSSPTRQRSSASSSRTTTTTTPTPLDNPKRRSWRTSLGFPPPFAVLPPSTHHRRTSSGLSFVRNFDENERPSTPGSPIATRNAPSSHVTPDGSPIALRNRFASTSSISSIAAGGPSSNLLFSPSAGAAEVAALSQANYALTVELSELEADTERSEREGRKKLRKLEKELQSLRDDLDRVEQRNAVLEDEAQAVNELARSVRAAPPALREETPETDKPASGDDDTPRFEYGEKSWREKMRDELGSDADAGDNNSEHSPVRSFDPFDRAHDENEDPFSASSDFLSPSRRAAGRGFGRFAASRSVSVSSLIPLPDSLLDVDDPSAEAHQDLIVEQLFAEIDELSQAKELLIAERAAVELRLDEAREELVEWKERCEELEEENVQARLLGWEGPRAAIAWHSEGDADADSDSSARAVARRRGPRRSAQHRSSRRRTVTDLSRATSGTDTSSDLSDSPATDLQTPISSPPLRDQRTLCSELDGHWGSEAAHLVDEHDFADTSTLSVVVHPLASKGTLRLSHPSESAYEDDSLVEQYPPSTTADNLVPAGSFRHVNPTTEEYDDLVQAAAELEPTWADDDPAVAALISHESSPRGGKSSSLSLFKQLEDKEAYDLRRRKDKKEKKRSGKGRKKRNALADFRFSDEDGEATEPGDITATLTRRDLALQRLNLEASSRFAAGSSSDDRSLSDNESVLSSNYDHLDDGHGGRSADYYPLTLRARYAPRMVVRMWTDSAVQHVVTLVTWLRFLVVLGMALVYAVYQGPKKTLGLVDGQRRLR
ncbi:hypothetical protein JCM6882_008935 [Rhodosporidiobolus microsporus]